MTRKSAEVSAVRAVDARFGRDDRLDLDLRTMAGEMAGNVRPGHFLALCWLTGHHHNFGNLGSDKQRHGVGHGPGSTPATVPADHYPIKLQTDSLNIRHNERGPTRVE